MTPEQLEQLKELVTKMSVAEHVEGCRDCAEIRRRYERRVTPRKVLDLIAEVEHQAEHIANLEHDMDATVKFCDEHHRGRTD